MLLSKPTALILLLLTNLNWSTVSANMKALMVNLMVMMKMTLPNQWSWLLSTSSQVQILVFSMLVMHFIKLMKIKMKVSCINQLVLTLTEMAQIWPALQALSTLSAWVADSSSWMSHHLSPSLSARPSNSRLDMSSTAVGMFLLNQASLHNGSTTQFSTPQLLPINLFTLSTPQLSLPLWTLVASGPTVAFNSGEIRTSSFRDLLRTTPLTISITRPVSVLLHQLLMLSTQRVTVLLGLFRPTTCGTPTPIFRTTPSLDTIMKMMRLNTTMFMLPCGSLLTGISITALSTSTAHKTSIQYHGLTRQTQHLLSKMNGNMVFSDQTTEAMTWTVSLS